MKRVLVVALLATLAPVAAFAGDLSHTHVEAGVHRAVVDVPASLGDDLEFDGGYVRGSFAMTPNLYAFGHYVHGTDDRFGADLDATRTNFGLGYNVALGERAEFIAEAGYLRDEIEDWDYDGGRVSAGLRGELGTRVEGWAKASYTDGNFSDGHYSGQVGALVKLTPTWGVTGEVELDDREDTSRYSLGVRASF